MNRTQKQIVGAATAAALITALGTGVYLSRGDSETIDTPNGTIENAEKILVDAERNFAQYVTEGGAFTAPDALPNCFFVKTEFVEPVITCGAIREADSLFGSYASTSLTLTTADGRVTGKPDVNFTPDFRAPVGAILVRPDGKGAVPASVLDAVADESLPILPDDLVGEGGVVSGAEGTQIEAVNGGVAGKTLAAGDGRGVRIVEAGQSTTIIVNGVEYRTAPGQIGRAHV